MVTDGEIGQRAMHAWQTLRDVVQAEGISDAAAARAFHETVAQPLLEYSKELQAKHAIVAEHAESMQAQFRLAQEKLLQNKIAALKLVEAQKAAEEREAHEREEKAGKGGGAAELAKAGKQLKSGLAFLFKSKDKQLTEALQSLSSDELRQQAFDATTLYSTSVEAANHRTATYFEHDLPTVLRQLQLMEATRLETLRLHLDQLSAHYNGLTQPSDARVASFSQAVAAMQTKADLDDYVYSLTTAIGVTPSKPMPFVYDLGFTAEDVKNNTVQLHPAPAEASEVVRLFGCSLLQVMEGQRGQHPGVDVPWLVPVLCEQIKKGGSPCSSRRWTATR